MGAITAYAGLMARRIGYKALYLSGGGVAANSLGVPDLGISTMEDVLPMRAASSTRPDAVAGRHRHRLGRGVQHRPHIQAFERVGVAAVHMEDQVGQKRCGHRPGKEVVPTGRWSTGSRPRWMHAPTPAS